MPDTSRPAKTATLLFDGKEIDLPVLSGSIGPDVIDIRKLYAQTGAFTYDPGLPPPPRAKAPSPSSTVTRGSCCTAGMTSTALRANRKSVG